jgi:uncharacterized protein YcsI (UPF0317 family)
MSSVSLDQRHPREIRADIRSGVITGVTAGLGAGYVQANLAVLPRELAGDFKLFCEGNAQACPLLGVSEPGCPRVPALAPDADLRRDVPRYRIYENGALTAEVADATPHWRDDLVAFLIGCSFTFEWALIDAGIPLWHLEHGRNVAMWRTSIACKPAGIFHGPMVVSMRPIPSHLVERAVAITARFPRAHGAPVHVGDPASIGIRDLSLPDWGDAPDLGPKDVPVFWACGVTPQSVALASRPSYMITHSPGHMFVTDVPNSELGSSQIQEDRGNPERTNAGGPEA